jgi:very-short-patch-repair endonuclease
LKRRRLPAFFGFQTLPAERAHFLRHNLTETEAVLWQQLSGNKLGVTFKRQVPIGKYIADFLAPRAKLVVEVDGGIHSARRSRDARRDRNLTRIGYRVVRLDAELVQRNVAQAVAAVVAVLHAVGYLTARRHLPPA